MPDELSSTPVMSAWKRGVNDVRRLTAAHTACAFKRTEATGKATVDRRGDAGARHDLSSLHGVVGCSQLPRARREVLARPGSPAGAGLRAPARTAGRASPTKGTAQAALMGNAQAEESGIYSQHRLGNYGSTSPLDFCWPELAKVPGEADTTRRPSRPPGGVTTLSISHCEQASWVHWRQPARSAVMVSFAAFRLLVE